MAPTKTPRRAASQTSTRIPKVALPKPAIRKAKTTGRTREVAAMAKPSTPGWFSGGDINFELPRTPSPFKNRRITRRSSVYVSRLMSGNPLIPVSTLPLDMNFPVPAPRRKVTMTKTTTSFVSITSPAKTRSRGSAMVTPPKMLASPLKTPRGRKSTTSTSSSSIVEYESVTSSASKSKRSSFTQHRSSNTPRGSSSEVSAMIQEIDVEGAGQSSGKATKSTSVRKSAAKKSGSTNTPRRSRSEVSTKETTEVAVSRSVEKTSKRKSAAKSSGSRAASKGRGRSRSPEKAKSTPESGSKSASTKKKTAVKRTVSRSESKGRGSSRSPKKARSGSKSKSRRSKSRSPVKSVSKTRGRARGRPTSLKTLQSGSKSSPKPDNAETPKNATPGASRSSKKVVTASKSSAKKRKSTDLTKASPPKKAKSPTKRKSTGKSPSPPKRRSSAGTPKVSRSPRGRRLVVEVVRTPLKTPVMLSSKASRKSLSSSASKKVSTKKQSESLSDSTAEQLRRAPTIILSGSSTPGAGSAKKKSAKVSTPRDANKSTKVSTPARAASSAKKTPKQSLSASRSLKSTKKTKMVVIRTPDTPRGITPKIVRKKTPGRTERILRDVRESGLRSAASLKKNILSPPRTSTPVALPRKRILDLPIPYSEIRQTRGSRNGAVLEETTMHSSVTVQESTMEKDVAMHSTGLKPEMMSLDEVDSAVEEKAVVKRTAWYWGWCNIL